MVLCALTNTILVMDGFIYLNPLLDDKILDWSKLREFADDNCKFDENGRKFSNRLGNTVGKGENARYVQFLLLSLCFQKTFTADK